MKLGMLEVGGEFLRSAMGLPESVDIYGCEWDFYRNRVKLYIKGEALDDVAPGAIVPTYQCLYTAGSPVCKLERADP